MNNRYLILVFLLRSQFSVGQTNLQIFRTELYSTYSYFLKKTFVNPNIILICRSLGEETSTVFNHADAINSICRVTT